MSLGHRAALLAVLLVPLISGAPRWSAARAVGGQEGINVTVEGILQLGEFHGPPNYGENPATDEVEHWYYLQLPAPISTQVPDMKWPAEFQGHDDGFFMSDSRRRRRPPPEGLQATGSP